MSLDTISEIADNRSLGPIFRDGWVSEGRKKMQVCKKNEWVPKYGGKKLQILEKTCGWVPKMARQMFK